MLVFRLHGAAIETSTNIVEYNYITAVINGRVRILPISDIGS